MTPNLLARLALIVSASLELTLIAKATVVLTLALVAVRCARRARASVRHVILASAFGALLLLPAVVVLLPPFPVAVSGAAVRDLPSARQIDVLVLDGRRRVTVIDHLPPGTPVQPGDRAAGLLRSIWSGVVLLSLAPIALALWRIHDLRRRGLPWLKGAPLARDIAARAGIRRSIDLLFHPDVETPLTCGLARPAIVLPSDADRWDEGQLRHALVHEMEHVRRGDTVVQLGARIVCALYWFHPLVWIAWRRLCLESERSCDDAVLYDSERTEYAGQLVELAGRLSGRAWLPGVSMANRSDLSARIAAILDNSQSRGRAGASSAGAILAVAALVVVGLSPLRAVTRAQLQADGRSATFEVASIKRNPSGDMRASIQALPGGYRAVNAPLRLLIRDAYALQGFQLVGGPSWLDSERFDILAKAEGSPTPDQERLMLRALLAERFALSVHNETRELPLYAMVMARADGKLGPQLRRTDADCAAAYTWQGTGPPPSRDGPCGSAGPGRVGGMRFRGVTLDAFAKFLATPAQRPVIDRTGLTGLFDIELELTAELGPPPPPPGMPDRVDRAFAPSMFTALQEQLGLKLDSRRGPIDVIVIDRVEPLVPN
jgi:bla regulator protein blaR1